MTISASAGTSRSTVLHVTRGARSPPGAPAPPPASGLCVATPSLFRFLRFAGDFDVDGLALDEADRLVHEAAGDGQLVDALRHPLPPPGGDDPARAGGRPAP